MKPRALQAALRFLRAEQRENGSFWGYASTQKTPFKSVRQQPTIFATALALDALTGVQQAAELRSAMATYLLKQAQPSGAWNYWDVDSAAAQNEPYPDDLDDTSCILAALYNHDPKLIDAGRLGEFARLLVSVEKQPGGPYNTWIADIAKTPQWRDIDLAVNANISYVLALQGVRLAGLETYIAEKLAAGHIASSYYVSTIPVLYFLARQSQKTDREMMQNVIKKQIVKLPLSNLEAALLLTTGLRVGISPTLLKPLATKLYASQANGHWPAEALYIDPVYDGVQHYGGSAVLVTCFAVEALQLYAESKQITPRREAKSTTKLSKVAELGGTIKSKEIKTRYLEIANDIADRPEAQQIVAAANMISQSARVVDPLMVEQLNKASLNGWIAYTLYDHFMDGDAKSPIDLTVANVAQRLSLEHYRQALPSNEFFNELVQHTFTTMDSANAWELSEARAAVSPAGNITIKKLPNYKSYTQLAQRSLGHSLAADGMILELFKSPTHPCYLALQQYFKHFLIARQLNDDAHDWEADLKKGHLTSVVCLLLKDEVSLQSIDYAANIQQLRERFWQHTIDDVVKIIKKQVTAAKTSLKKCEMYIDTAEQRAWVEALEQSAQTALASRNETLAFMQSFEGNHE